MSMAEVEMLIGPIEVGGPWRMDFEQGTAEHGNPSAQRKPSVAYSYFPYLLKFSLQSGILRLTEATVRM